jgi:hypothetical protein
MKRTGRSFQLAIAIQDLDLIWQIKS